MHSNLFELVQYFSLAVRRKMLIDFFSFSEKKKKFENGKDFEVTCKKVR